MMRRAVSRALGVTATGSPASSAMRRRVGLPIATLATSAVALSLALSTQCRLVATSAPRGALPFSLLAVGGDVCSGGGAGSAVEAATAATNADCAAAANPLLAGDGIPRFDAITAAHVAPAIATLVAAQDAVLPVLERAVSDALAAAANGGPPVTYAGVVDAAGLMSEPLGWAWSALGHLLGVRNEPALRDAFEAAQPAVIAAGLRAAQSPALYRGLCALRDSPAAWAALDVAQRRVVEAGIRAAEHSGVALVGAARARFNAIEAELGELGTAFGNRVLDATKAFALDLASPEEAAGLPPSLLAAAAQAARASGHAPEATAERGPWRVTLAAPMALPFLEHCRVPALRERVYRALVTRASGPAPAAPDNAPAVARILALRAEQAQLLGYASYAALSLSAKMAGTASAVDALLGDLRTASMPHAKAEHAALEAFARAASANATTTTAEATIPNNNNNGNGALRHWDIAFWSERQREQLFAFTDEELRPYFALPRVLDGMFALARRLFGINVSAADGEAPVWHPDVRYFRVSDAASGEQLASFFLDPYSRPADKRGGAWMDGCVSRRRLPNGAVRLPVAYLVCNMPAPDEASGAPSLLTFRDVETLHHEFGHGLQHMLTTVDHADAAGIRGVEWDAVELPSQFLENFCLHRATLLAMARHWRTGDALPDALFEKLTRAKTYRAGSQMMRQLYFATLDLTLHSSEAASGGIDAATEAVAQSIPGVVARVAATNTVLPPLPEDRQLCSFSHIFAGGYAAGYYSYKWAEVLSADAFAAFEEAGLEDEAVVATTGRRFRDTVLARGGGQHPTDVFVAFRGRKPTVDALLRHGGLNAPPS